MSDVCSSSADFSTQTSGEENNLLLEHSVESEFYKYTKIIANFSGEEELLRNLERSSSSSSKQMDGLASTSLLLSFTTKRRNLEAFFTCTSEERLQRESANF